MATMCNRWDAFVGPTLCIDLWPRHLTLTFELEASIWLKLQSNTWPWPWPRALTLTFDLDLKSRLKTTKRWHQNRIKKNFWLFDLDLWPPTLGYIPSLARVTVEPHAKNQDQRSTWSSGLNRRVPTTKRTDATKCVISPASRSIMTVKHLIKCLPEFGDHGRYPLRWDVPYARQSRFTALGIQLLLPNPEC